MSVPELDEGDTSIALFHYFVGLYQTLAAGTCHVSNFTSQEDP